MKKLTRYVIVAFISAVGLVNCTPMLSILPSSINFQVQGFEEARLRFGRVQRYQGTLDCFLSVLRQEGPLAFYKGISPSLIKVHIQSSLQIN